MRPPSGRRTALDLPDTLSRLAADARTGGRAATETLLRRSAGIVHAITRARLGDGLAAEEAAVESLARIARGLPGLRDPQAYLRWAGRVTERCVADVARNRPPAEPLVTDPIDPGQGPVALAVATERSQRLRAALADLRPRLRAPVLLHFVEGLSYREIGRTLGVGLGTVARRMDRALAALRRALGGES